MLHLQKSAKRKEKSRAVASQTPDGVHRVGLQTTSKSRDCNESSDRSDEADLQSQEKDGILKEEEKDALRTLELTVEECDTEGRDEMASSDEDSSHDDYDSDLGIRNLRHALEQTSTGSLRHRQVSHLLQVRLEELERAKQAEGNIYKKKQQSVMLRGVTREHATLLPRDRSRPCIARLPMNWRCTGARLSEPR